VPGSREKLNRRVDQNGLNYYTGDGQGESDLSERIELKRMILITKIIHHQQTLKNSSRIQKNWSQVFTPFGLEIGMNFPRPRALKTLLLGIQDIPVVTVIQNKSGSRLRVGIIDA
jgi:hypothetical protein